MPKGRPITLYEREKIETYLRMGKKKKWIADRLKRDYSVIKREIKRNSGEYLSYIAEDAHYYAKRRKSKTNKRKLEKWQNKELRDYVEERLNEGWSPEEIAGRLEKHPPTSVMSCEDKRVSYEAIYDWIYNGEGRFGGLYKKLRRKKSSRQRRFNRKKQKKTNIKGRISIHKRSKIIDKRKRVGDWETDSVIFSDKSILSVQLERKTRLCRIHKCVDKTAAASEKALRNSINSLPKEFWLTVTRDNGTENVLHYETKIPSYFCDPYASWQKGGVENINGLIREYFPKRSNLDTVDERDVYEVQERLNNRPRKILNYLTPNEVIALEMKKLKKGL